GRHPMARSRPQRGRHDGDGNLQRLSLVRRGRLRHPDAANLGDALVGRRLADLRRTLRAINTSSTALSGAPLPASQQPPPPAMISSPHVASQPSPSAVLPSSHSSPSSSTPSPQRAFFTRPTTHTSSSVQPPSSLPKSVARCQVTRREPWLTCGVTSRS